MIVKIDERERLRHYEAFRCYQKKHTIIIEKLPIGDFIFSNGKNEVVFEYKKFNDFRKSMNEGRLFDQALRQYSNFKYHFIIIEVDEEKKHELLSNNKFREAIASLNTFTTVITCPTTSLALKMMEKQAELCLEGNPLEKRPFEKLDNVAYNYLILIKGVNKIKAHNICKHLNLKTFEDLKQVTTKQLRRVPGIGSITAQKITTSIRMN